MPTLAGFVVVLGCRLVTVRDRLGAGAGRRLPALRRHAEGRRLTRERLIMRSAVDPSTLQHSIVRGLGLPYDRSTALRAELFQGPAAAGHVQFCSGTKTSTVFTAGMRLEPSASGGSTLTYGVEAWTLAGGVVAGIPQLRFLRRRVEEEARNVDPHIDVVVDAERARR